MAANATPSLPFTDDVTTARSSTVNSKVYMAMLFALTHSNARKLIRQCFAVQMDKNMTNKLQNNPRVSHGKQMWYSSITKSIT